MKSVGFVILTWNSEKYIQNCLRAIFDIDTAAFECTVVVVDNGSIDQTVECIKTECSLHKESQHSCVVTCLDKNYGTTRSRNIGLKKLQEIKPDIEFLCILDSDTEINEKALDIMTDELSDPTVGIVGPRMHDTLGIYQVSGKNFPTFTEKLCKVMPLKSLRMYGEHQERIIPPQGTGTRPVGYVMSACWLMRKSTIDMVGYFDERIFYAPEDVEYCIRCWKAGYKVAYCYDADILHHWQRLSRKKLISKHNYEHIKGLLYVFNKYKYMFSTKRLWKSLCIYDSPLNMQTVEE